MLLHNSQSAVPQLITEVRTKKLRNCDCGLSKLEFRTSATLSQIRNRFVCPYLAEMRTIIACAHLCIGCAARFA
jgi:hypothetical protein